MHGVHDMASKYNRLEAEDDHDSYARVSKNFIHRGCLAKAGQRYGLTGRDLYFFVALLAEAQRRGKRRLAFRSIYELRKGLKWPSDGRARDAVYHALETWQVVELIVPKYYVANLKVTKYDPNNPSLFSDPHSERPGLGKDKHGKRIVVENIMTVRWRLGGGFTVMFDKDFWHACSKRMGFFVGSWPEIVKKLQYPTEIYLYFLLEAFLPKADKRRKSKKTDDDEFDEEKREVIVQLHRSTLAQMINFPIRSIPSFDVRLAKAVDHINRAADHAFIVRETVTGAIQIRQENYSESCNFGDNVEAFKHDPVGFNERRLHG